MAQIVFPMPSGELTLEVLIGHSQQALAAVVAAGQGPPALFWAKGVIDTGTNVTCVTPAVLPTLGSVPIGRNTTQTVAGQSGVDIHKLSLSIAPPGRGPGPMPTRKNLLVMEMPGPIPGVEVLVGLDILLDCKMLLDGPARRFTLDF